MFKSLILTLGTFLFATQIIFAQNNNPDFGVLYADTIVPRIDININPDTLTWLYQQANLESDLEFTATFVFNNGDEIDTVSPVGFRLRGNTSRHSAKKSFKVSFNRFKKGGKFHGVEKLNLNGEHNDPSLMRSKICWDIFRKLGIPASRASFVRVYINDNYYGLYLSVEHIDENFVKSRFRYNDGNLYKCLYPADLRYLGPDQRPYKFIYEDRRAYDLKINEEKDDYSDLVHFIDVLNNTPDEKLNCELNSVFNVYDYLKVIAADVLLGNWDGYIYNKNNYYLYHNTSTDKFEYIPYDLDNTLGVDWFGIDWETRDMYNWQQGTNNRPLYEKLIQNQMFRDQYTFYMRRLVNTLNLDSLETVIKKRRDMIAPYVANDPYYPQDYGYTMTDFYNSYTQAIDDHVKYGLFPFLETHISSIKQQLESTEMLPVIKYISQSRTSDSVVWIQAYVDVNNPPSSVKIQYTIQGQNGKVATMYDDGQHQDGADGDHTFGGKIDSIPQNASVSYQVSASDANQHESIQPCEPVLIPEAGGDEPLLYINEFAADNDHVITDNHGDYDDWIEIYNGGNQTYWLGNKYLTDNLSKPNKWQMPDKYIQPGQFLLFWADDEEDQGFNHTNFKLSKDGEEIGIFDANLNPIDEYVFGPQQTDVSEGRLPNGGATWTFFGKPTPGTSNETNAVSNIENPVNVVIAYPNPTSHAFIHLSKVCSYKVFDMMGRQIDQQKSSDRIDTRDYKNGIYLVVLNNGQHLKILVN